MTGVQTCALPISFVNQSITVTLEDGSYRTYEINIQRYLEQLYKRGESKEETALAANMISYLASSAVYFYKNTAKANAALAVRDTVLGAGYDEANKASSLVGYTAEALTEGCGIKGAGLSLAERPTFYFVLADGERAENVSFRIGECALRYETVLVDGDTYFILKQSPDTLLETVTYKVGEKEGTFNLFAYYDYAMNNDSDLATLIKRLVAYVDSVNALFS